MFQNRALESKPRLALSPFSPPATAGTFPFLTIIARTGETILPSASSRPRHRYVKRRNRVSERLEPPGFTGNEGAYTQAEQKLRMSGSMEGADFGH